MKRLRLALIGAGKIAHDHARAFLAAGFDLAAVCARPGSPRSRELARRFGIPLVFDEVDALLAARERWDALLIAVSPEASLEVLAAAAKTGAPILVEKPVALRSQELRPLLGRDLPVLVGYNRRFYKTAAQARRAVAESDCAFLAHVMLPEAVSPAEGGEGTGRLRPFFTNSTHGLDLIRYVFGEVDLCHVERIGRGGKVAGIAALLRARTTGSVIQLTANWGAPVNFSFGLYRQGYSFEMRPLEVGVIYDGMEVREPTPRRPVRTYTPRAARRLAARRDQAGLFDSGQSLGRPRARGRSLPGRAAGRCLRGAAPRRAALRLRSAWMSQAEQKERPAPGAVLRRGDGDGLAFA